jgi:hypothetical protein
LLSIAQQNALNLQVAQLLDAKLKGAFMYVYIYIELCLCAASISHQPYFVLSSDHNLNRSFVRHEETYKVTLHPMLSAKRKLEDEDELDDMCYPSKENDDDDTDSAAGSASTLTVSTEETVAALLRDHTHDKRFIELLHARLMRAEAALEKLTQAVADGKDAATKSKQLQAQITILE